MVRPVLYEPDPLYENRCLDIHQMTETQPELATKCHAYPRDAYARSRGATAVNFPERPNCRELSREARRDMRCAKSISPALR